MTAGSGVRSPASGSSGPPSPHTGRPSASASSDSARRPASPAERVNGPTSARHKRRRGSTGSRLSRFDRALDVRFVAGADEAGRGCLAGPLVAAAVLFDYERLSLGDFRMLSALNDSKQHSAEMRDELY